MTDRFDPVAKRQWRELIRECEAAAGAPGPAPSLRRRWPLLVVAAFVAWGVTATAFSFASDRAWERATSLGALREEGVVFLRERAVFVVANGAHPVALFAASPHQGERLLYCRLNDTFLDEHGDGFDRLGRYLMGPAPRGMDLLSVRVRGGTVEINPKEVSPGAARFHPRARQPTGPFCAAPGRESPAGFFKLPPPSESVGFPPVPMA